LVVDDETRIVDAVTTAFRYEGYDVDEAHTGREALDLAIQHAPDLIVHDWVLPDIEGIEVGRRLRARGYKTAVLFLTAKNATENKVEALRAGGDDYVTKPFQPRRARRACPGDPPAYRRRASRRGPSLRRHRPRRVTARGPAWRDCCSAHRH